MRDILFEGRSTETGERVIGYYAKAVDSITDAETHVIFPLDTLLFPRNEFAGYVKIVPKSLREVGMSVVRNENNGDCRCPHCHDRVYYPSLYCSECGQKLEWRHTL